MKKAVEKEPVTAKALAKLLKNVGPILAQRMIDSGIDTPEKLKKIGAKSAYVKLYNQGDKYGDFNAAYLFALEGAIRDCNWLEIPEKVKQEYKEFAQQLQSKKRK